MKRKRRKEKNSVVVKKSICKIQKKERRKRKRQKAELSREKEVYTTQAAKKDRHTYTTQIRTDGRTDRGTFIFYRVVEKKIQQHTQNKKN